MSAQPRVRTRARPVPGTVTPVAPRIFGADISATIRITAPRAARVAAASVLIHGKA